MQEYIGSFFRTAFIFFLKFYFSKKKPSTEISSSIPEEKTVEFRVKVFSIRNKREKAARTKKDLGDWKTR